MLVNTELTLYHYVQENGTYIRHNYDKVWWNGGKGAGISKGYENANDVDVRIPYDMNKNLNANDIAIGDIIIKGKLLQDITSQQDLNQKDIYTITSILDSTFGLNQHIYLGGK